MRSAPTPSAYFYLSEDFDYRSYLETRSHFDQIPIAIDQQTAALVGGLERLRSANQDNEQAIDALQSINSNLSRGLDEANRNLSNIASDTEEIAAHTYQLMVSNESLLRETSKLAPLLDWGFSSTTSALSEVSSRLDRLINAFESKDQTWAFEQYRIARSLLFQDGLVHESLDYLNRAIEGYKSEPGYPLEPEFFFLRGSIRLGVLDAISVDLVDTAKAIADFEKAARYSKNRDKEIFSRSLAMIGRAYYCSGQPVEAISYFQKALEKGQKGNPEILFNLAKAHAVLGVVDAAMANLKAALELEWAFAYRATADRDFIAVRADVDRVIGSYHYELIIKLGQIFDATDFRRISDLLKGRPTSRSSITPEETDQIRMIVDELAALSSLFRKEQTARLAEAWKALTPSFMQDIRSTLVKNRRERLDEIETSCRKRMVDAKVEVAYIKEVKESAVTEPKKNDDADGDFKSFWFFAGMPLGLGGLGVGLYNMNVSGSDINFVQALVSISFWQFLFFIAAPAMISLFVSFLYDRIISSSSHDGIEERKRDKYSEDKTKDSISKLNEIERSSQLEADVMNRDFNAAIESVDKGFRLVKAYQISA
jgi:tetratricopeptide (TPR) repeat protein